MKKKRRRSQLIIISIIIATVLIGFLYTVITFTWIFGTDRYEVSEKSEVTKEEIQKIQAAKPAFETEFTYIIPDSLRTTKANYGDDFSIHYAQELFRNHEFDGYDASRVFRVRDLARDEIEAQIRSHLESNGYIVGKNLSVTSSPRNFDVDILLIPFEDQGYIDIQVELYRRY